LTIIPPLYWSLECCTFPVRQKRYSLLQWLFLPRLMESRLALNIHHLTLQYLWEVAELKIVEAVVKS